ncbi:MAG: YeeE/YedE family protein [Xanthobacteraceae bacterium]
MTDLSVDARLLASERGVAPHINTSVVILASAVLAAGAIALGDAYSWRQGALFLVGGALGVALYHALFGFTSAWRVFIADGRGAGLRAQMLMLAAAAILFFPALGHGSLFGQPVHGEYGAVGVSLIVGSFMFGLGMQLGGGCASGTLYTVGGGNARMLVTLAFFIVGSALGAWHLPWWSALPNVGKISLIAAWGWAPALAASLAGFAAIAALTIAIERRFHGTLRHGVDTDRRGFRRFLYGPWPLVAGAIALALGNFATLYLAGRPWGITSAFALWGSKLFAASGVDAASWGYWQGAERAKALHGSIFADITSIMDFGIILGALLASGLAGKFRPGWRVPLRSLVAAVLGGLLLGYGARLAYGCNIGAYFSGVVSSSVHGWVWLACAFLGSVFGTFLRPWFGLSVEGRLGKAQAGRSARD